MKIYCKLLTKTQQKRRAQLRKPNQTKLKTVPDNRFINKCVQVVAIIFVGKEIEMEMEDILMRKTVNFRCKSKKRNKRKQIQSK